MANVNKLILVGRVTHDPEMKTFQNGGAVCNFSFCVNDRAKNKQTSAWEDVPMYIRCAIFDRGEYKQATRFYETVRKGSQVYLEGRIRLNQYTDKDGNKRSNHEMIVNEFQYLDPRPQQNDGQQGGQQPQNRQQGNQQGGGRQQPPQGRQQAPQQYDDDQSGYAAPNDDIPF